MAHKKKRKKRLNPKEKTRHHRRPTSIHGTSDRRNLSTVVREMHEAWHHVFGNMCAPKIAATIESLANRPDLHVACIRRPEPFYDFQCHAEIKRGRRCGISCIMPFVVDDLIKSWNSLQTLIAKATKMEASIVNTVAYINAHLLDADYKLELI